MGMTGRRLRGKRGAYRGVPSMMVLAGVLVSAVLSPGALAAPAEAVTCLTIPPGIQAYWPGNGTPDELAYGRDGTLVGDAAYAPGQIGQGFVFDGTGDAVEVPDSPVWSLGSDDFSQSMWVKMDATGRAVFTSHDEGGTSPYPKWLFYLDSGSLYFGVNWPFNGQNIVSAEWTPSTGTWYHIAVTREGDTWTLYVNGSAVGTAAREETLPEIQAPLRLGHAETNEDGEFSLDGTLDEVIFFQRSLTADELSALYTAGSAGVQLCDPIGTTLTLTPSQTTVWNGLPLTLDGQLTLDGAPSVAGRSVTITRQVNDNPSKVVATVTTAADGSYTYTETPPLGTVRYTAWFEGADNAVPASAETTVTVEKRVATVSLTAGDKHLVIGQSTKLVAELTGGRVNREVAIWAKPVGQDKRLVKKGNVGSDDTLIATVQPRLNTTFWAVYTGDVTWTADTSRDLPVDVKIRWKVKVVNSYDKASGYYLFHYQQSCIDDGKGCPVFGWTLIPEHPKVPVTVVSQYKIDGTWRQNKASFDTNANSILWIWYTYGDSRVIGVPQRTRVEYAGDRTHVGASSDWVYWKVTR